jgi:hypothetical protein
MTSIINASTTAGVIITSDTSGNLALQTGGGTYTQTVPNATGTVMVSGNMPAFSAYQSSAQSISANTWTKVTFTTVEFDTNSNYSSSRFTPTVAGYYQVSGGVNPNGLSSSLYTAIYKNGTINKRAGTVNSSGDSIIISALVYFNGSTDYVEIYTYLGTSLNLGTGTPFTYFQAAMVRAA